MLVDSPSRADFCTWLLTLALVWASAGTRIEGQNDQKRVLVLYSTGREAVIALTGERDLPRILDKGLDRRLDFHSEYLDAGRFSDERYQAAFRDFLRLKYGGQRFDAVIAMLDVAVEFVSEHRDELFPGTPVIFLARNTIPNPIPNATGVVSEVDFAETLRLATALQPEINQVFVVSGSGSRDRAVESEARKHLSQFEPRLGFTYLSGLPTPALEQKLATLPERSIVYYLLVYQDGSGQSFQPVEYLDRLALVSNRPIYSWVDSTIDHGVVGGGLENLDLQVAAVARLALRVLHGESADGIPVSSESLSKLQIDWRQLRRWGISEARIPAETIVSFRNLGVWEQYRTYILAVGFLVFAQAALIGGLMLQARRRRRAEAEVRRNQTELRTSYERISDLGRRLLVAQEAERSRIARELHDDISQQMALLSMDLEVLKETDWVRKENGENLARGALERAQGISRTVHDLSHRLHPEKLRLLGLVAALQSLQREWAQSNLTVKFSHENVPEVLSHDLTLCLFRIVQEALQNVSRHSGAREVTIDLKGVPPMLNLTVVDNGRGFDVAAAWGKGLGLISMSERLESLGGHLTIRSTRGAGTALTITAPVATVHGAKPIAGLRAIK